LIAPTTLIALLATSIAASGTPAFEGTSEPIAGKVRERMIGNSWHRGCPVGLGEGALIGSGGTGGSDGQLVPEPATLALFGFGLAAVAVSRRRRPR
jgi:hypothetical protein